MLREVYREEFKNECCFEYDKNMFKYNFPFNNISIYIASAYAWKYRENKF